MVKGQHHSTLMALSCSPALTAPAVAANRASLVSSSSSPWACSCPAAGMSRSSASATLRGSSEGSTETSGTRQRERMPGLQSRRRDLWSKVTYGMQVTGI